MMHAVRPTAVAGAFYDDDPRALARQVDGYIAQAALPPVVAQGLVVPHAGHIYSGAICGRALASVVIPPSVLLLHTKHVPGGGALSLATYDGWRTPLGEVACDAALTRALAQIPGVEPSNVPHGQEHAAEVVLPLLQRLRPDVRVAVISVAHVPYALLETIGVAIAGVLGDSDVLPIASSDMNHFDDLETTLRKDRLALAELQRFAPEAMLEVCEREGITMCGAAATALMLIIARARGASTVELLEHDTSAAVSGDRHRTVGYASARVR